MDGLWQVDRAPRVGALRGAAARVWDIPAAVAALRIDPAANPTSPAELLAPCVGVRLAWHPSTAQLLHDAGATAESATTYTLAVTGPAARPGALGELAARVLPTAWVHPTGAATHAPLDADALAELLEHPPQPTRPTAPPSTKPGAGWISVTRKGRIATLRLLVEPVLLPAPLATPTGLPLKVGAARAVRLRPAQVPAALTALRKAGVIAVDADTPARFADLGWVHDRRLVLTPTPGAPGWASVETGPLVTSAIPELVPVANAVAAARPATGKVALALDPLVIAAATGAGAASVPSAVPGVALRSWQEQFIGQYLANGTGLVNALPPGAGKTACVAGAMAAAATRATPGGTPHRGLVVAPTTLLEQWAAELGVFHPTAHVALAHVEGDLSSLRAAWDRPGPVVALVAPGLIAKHPGTFAALPLDDLAIDEGTYLRTDSAQTRALWDVRRGARRAAVLTGTPDTGLPGTVEALVSFVAGRPALMAGGPPAALAGLGAVELAGPWVFGQSADLAGVLPGATPRPTSVPAGDYERALAQVASARVTALLAGADTPAKRRRAATSLRAELDGWRTGLACPAALLSGKSALARQLRSHLGDAGLLPAHLADAPPTLAALLTGAPETAGVKVAWAAQWVAGAPEEPSLVFSDSVPALEALAAALTSAGVRGVAVLSGKVRPPARARLVEQFTAGQLTVLLIASTGQLGLNLQAASRVAHLDIPATASSLTQRGARAARMGSAHTSVTVAVPVVTPSAEEVWWAHTGGASAPTDILGLAEELTRPAPRSRGDRGPA